MMIRSIRRLTAAILAGTLLLALTACGSKTNDTATQLAMTVNGHEVEVGVYAANYLYGKASIENMMYQYGVTDLWDSELGDSYKSQLGEIAQNQTAALYLVPDQFDAAGLTLTDEDLSRIGEMDPSMKEMGFTDSLFDQVSRYFLMQEQLEEYYFGEGGAMAPDDAEIESYFQENYMRAKHILISTRDENNQPLTDEAALAEIERKAQSVYQRAVAGEDFDTLIQEFGEDPGMSANPDGYQFTEGDMVAEFQDATKALAENTISAPVQSDYGWHIIQRLPLRAEDRPAVYSSIVTALTGMDMDSLLNQWVNEAEITTEAVLSEITFDNAASYTYHVS